MRPSFPLLAPLGPTQLGPCVTCAALADDATAAIKAFADRWDNRAVHVGCACGGRSVATVAEHDGERQMPAAGVGKLALLLAGIRGHHAGTLDLTSRLRISDLEPTREASPLDVLAEQRELGFHEILALGLLTDANPPFSLLSDVVGPQGPQTLGLEAVVSSRYGDIDLGSGVRAHRVSARAASALLVNVVREATGVLYRLALGLVNSTHTARLVRDVDQLVLPGGFLVANKIGTLGGVRNDVALYIAGDGALVVSALSDDYPSGPLVDDEMASLGRELCALRFGERENV